MKSKSEELMMLENIEQLYECSEKMVYPNGRQMILASIATECVAVSLRLLGFAIKCHHDSVPYFEARDVNFEEWWKKISKISNDEHEMFRKASDNEIHFGNNYSNNVNEDIHCLLNVNNGKFDLFNPYNAESSYHDEYYTVRCKYEDVIKTYEQLHLKILMYFRASINKAQLEGVKVRDKEKDLLLFDNLFVITSYESLDLIHVVLFHALSLLSECLWICKRRTEFITYAYWNDHTDDYSRIMSNLMGLFYDSCFVNNAKYKLIKEDVFPDIEKILIDAETKYPNVKFRHYFDPQKRILRDEVDVAKYLYVSIRSDDNYSNEDLQEIAIYFCKMLSIAKYYECETTREENQNNNMHNNFTKAELYMVNEMNKFPGKPKEQLKYYRAAIIAEKNT